MAEGQEGVAGARALLEAARRLVVVTGAGISAESGVPTFRGPEGLWRSHRPEDLATPEAFRRDPLLVWSWYGWRRERVAACAPNDGHRALARLAYSPHREVTLVTQNVDGLHEAAAADEAGGAAALRGLPLTLHGSLVRDRCSGCGRRTPAATVGAAATVEDLPRCALCGALLRPDVVWFGEALDAQVLHRAFEAAMECDVCLAVGTSGVVHPAASIPLAAARAGAALVEVNPEDTALTPWSTLSLRGGAATLLPLLLAGLGPLGDAPAGTGPSPGAPGVRETP